MIDVDVPETYDTLEGIDPPQLTSRLVGHSDVSGFLAQAVAGGKLHHGLIFEGERGIGKATLAYHFAHMLLSGAGPDTDGRIPPPDPQGSAFRQIAQGAHPGLLGLGRPRNDQGTGFRSAVTVDEIRRVQRFFSMTAASPDAWRIVIVDPVNDLNRNAANALLKMLEEPPQRALFLLIAHGTGGLLPTIRSRCQIVRFSPLGDEDMHAVVESAVGGDDAEIARLVALGGGSARRALVFARFGGLDLMQALAEFLDAARPDVVKAHKLAEVAGARGADIHRDILRELILGRLHQASISAARRGDSRAADRLATLDMSMQERIRLSDTYNLDRKQDLLSILADVHSALHSTAA
ncbi:DNA polymerase III subunit delta' [Oricola sp.]|uniref:DNA polymerase III subunit delta' n=1 Tax=Oricola sp. TaxID=1979950 RepID=UPI003BACB972